MRTTGGGSGTGKLRSWTGRMVAKTDGKCISISRPITPRPIFMFPFPDAFLFRITFNRDPLVVLSSELSGGGS